MKKLLPDIITKFMDFIKTFIVNESNEIKFQSTKNRVIKVMYNPILEKKENQKDSLLIELNKINQECLSLSSQISEIKKENAFYTKKLEALNTFHDFLLNNCEK